MTKAIEAIYEGGLLRLLEPLALLEHTHVRVSVETLPEDPERAARLDVACERSGMERAAKVPPDCGLSAGHT